MGFKNVCLNCRRVESMGYVAEFRTGNCPECSTLMYFVNHKFRPPAITDEKSWAISSLLITNGFDYRTFWDDNGASISYPSTLYEAKEFVEKHQDKIRARRTERRKELKLEIARLESKPCNITWKSSDEHRQGLLHQLKHEYHSITRYLPDENAG